MSKGNLNVSEKDIHPYFVWIDFETTGLDPEKDVPLAIGVIVTKDDLEPILQREYHIWQPEEVLNRMSPFVKKMHTENNLLKHVQFSNMDIKDVENILFKEIIAIVPHKTGIMAGSTIHFDRFLLKKHMPQINEWLHYRNLDVSSIKELVKLWRPQHRFHTNGNKAHTPIADLQHSISELKHYRDSIFVPDYLSGS